MRVATTAVSPSILGAPWATVAVRVPVMAAGIALVMAPAITVAAAGVTSAFPDFISTLAVMVAATSKEC